MSGSGRTDAATRLEDVLQDVDDEIEDLATAGGITADTRGDLSVERIEETADEFLETAWESQKQAMDETGNVDPKTIC